MQGKRKNDSKVLATSLYIYYHIFCYLSSIFLKKVKKIFMQNIHSLCSVFCIFIHCAYCTNTPPRMFYNLCKMHKPQPRDPGHKDPRNNFFNPRQRPRNFTLSSCHRKFDFCPKFAYNIDVRKIKQEIPSVQYLHIGRTYITH